MAENEQATNNQIFQSNRNHIFVLTVSNMPERQQEENNLIWIYSIHLDIFNIQFPYLFPIKIKFILSHSGDG